MANGSPAMANAYVVLHCCCLCGFLRGLGRVESCALRVACVLAVRGGTCWGARPPGGGRVVSRGGAGGGARLEKGGRAVHSWGVYMGSKETAHACCFLVSSCLRPTPSPTPPTPLAARDPPPPARHPHRPHPPPPRRFPIRHGRGVVLSTPQEVWYGRRAKGSSAKKARLAQKPARYFWCSFGVSAFFAAHSQPFLAKQSSRRVAARLSRR